MYSVLNKLSEYIISRVKKYSFIHFCRLFLKCLKAFSVSLMSTGNTILTIFTSLQSSLCPITANKTKHLQLLLATTVLLNQLFSLQLRRQRVSFKLFTFTLALELKELLVKYPFK